MHIMQRNYLILEYAPIEQQVGQTPCFNGVLQRCNHLGLMRDFLQIFGAVSLHPWGSYANNIFWHGNRTEAEEGCLVISGGISFNAKTKLCLLRV
jgi:hypothetical protein